MARAEIPKQPIEDCLDVDVAKDESLGEIYHNFHVIKNETVDRGADYDEYRRLWNLTALERVVTPFPLHLDIEVSSNCNLLCPMCPRTHRVERGQWESVDLSFDAFKKIIDEGVPLGLRAINLNNFGESLLNPHLVDMVRYAKDRGVIDIMMHTNGTLMTPKTSRALMEAGIDTVIFSIDSISKQLYERIRVNGNFDKTVANIRNFAAIRRERGADLPQIRVNMVLMKENEKEAEAFEAFWGEDVDQITYVDYRNQDGLDSSDRYVKKKPENQAYACPSLWQRMTINASGEVTACCRDAGKRLTIGALSDDVSLLDIWTGQSLLKARELHERGEGWKLEACNGCDHIRGHQPPETDD